MVPPDKIEFAHATRDHGALCGLASVVLFHMGIEQNISVEGDTKSREDMVLHRILSTPPQPKSKKSNDAKEPKKRGRPTKVPTR